MTMLRNTVAEQQWGSIPATMCALDGNGNLQALPANQDLTILPSATRTATTYGNNISNLTGCGIAVFLNVTAASGTGGLQVTVQQIDPVSGTAGSIYTASTKTTTGVGLYLIYPGISSGGTAAYNSVLPGTIRVGVIHGDGSNYTYSVGASIIF